MPRTLQSRVGVIAHAAGDTNGVLVSKWRRLGLDAHLLPPDEAATTLAASDVALVRLDVRRTLDGIEPGLDAVQELDVGGFRVLNRVESLRAVHDKLVTARLMQEAEIPHPRTVHVTTSRDELPFAFPVVVKPRFGSWGRDVFRCATRRQFEECLRHVEDREWFRGGGALVQELVSPLGFDLRILVAGDRVVGSAQRIAAHGNWRTNVSLGGRLVPRSADGNARALALAAARATGIDLAAIDVLPSDRGWIVLELNGAADFDDTYSPPGRNVFADVAGAVRLRRVASDPHSLRHRPNASARKDSKGGLQMILREIMNPNVVTVTPQTSLKESLIASRREPHLRCAGH